PLACCRSRSRRPIWVSFACACLALSFLQRKRSTKRSSRAMSTPRRSAVLPAAEARAAFSIRQACHGPEKEIERPPASSSTPFVTASRNQRSCATRMIPASSDCSSCSSHSRLALGRDEVGGAGQHVLAQGQALVERRPLVMERDARPLGEHELAALVVGLAVEDPQQRRLAGAVRSRERDPLAALDLERDAVE